jgi:uncharacterized phage infection (PIP) family protein YhgE
LNKEVSTRKEAIGAAQASRDQLNTSLREEIKSAITESQQSATAIINKVDRRADANSDAIKNLENSLEAVVKDHTDTTASHKKQMKTERQLTEDMGSERLQLIQEVRDNFESHLQNVSSELRQTLADTKKKVYEETNALRAELREQPTKRELVELASTTTEQYNELSTAIDGHRTRLEAAVADYGTKVREARSESGEARLRMQREAMALAAELTTLRGAASSLANGVLKALQVIGFIRDDVELASGKESKKEKETTDAEGGEGKKEHQRAIEIEDLLEWEKVGKSLAARVARQWYLQESNGIPTMMSLVERKADSEELVVLKTILKESPPTSWPTGGFNETSSTMASSMQASAPTSPKPGTAPPGVAKAREQRLVGSDA